MRWKRSVALVVAGVAVLAPLSAASANPAKPGKVDICHYDEELGTYKKLTISEKAVPAHLANHPDGFVGDAVPGMRGYAFGPDCTPVSQVVTINFDDLVTGGEVNLDTISPYAGFVWTKGWVFAPAAYPGLGYTASSAPNTAFIGFPRDGQPMTLVSVTGAVSFTSVHLNNPTGSATDPDGPLTITIEARYGGLVVGSQQVVLADGASTTAALTFDNVDELRLSANGKYFAVDDLSYFPA